MTLIFVCGKLPGPERRAGRGIRDRGAASGSNPDSSSRVCPTSRLVNGSHSGRRWGEPQLKVKTAFGQTQLTVRAYDDAFSLFLRFFDGQTMSCIFFLLASHMTEIDIVQSDSAWFNCVVLLLCWYQTLGLSSASTGMFYNGAGDLVLHFITQCNSQLTEILAEQHKQVQLGQAEYVYHTHTHTHLLSNFPAEM